MSEAVTAQDFLDAITDVLADLGTTRTVRITTRGALNPSNPGAGPSLSTDDYSVEAILYDYMDSQIDGSTIQTGDRVAVLSIDPLTSGVIDTILPNAKLIDGSTVYTIVRTSPVEVAGEKVTVFLQIRG